jgi:MbtH protein
MREERQMDLIFKVIVNHEGNGYSFWIADREDPPGWRDAGQVRGSAMECLAYIKELSFRGRQPEAAPESSPASRENPRTRAVWA